MLALLKEFVKDHFNTYVAMRSEQMIALVEGKEFKL